MKILIILFLIYSPISLSDTYQAINLYTITSQTGNASGSSPPAVCAAFLFNGGSSHNFIMPDGQCQLMTLQDQGMGAMPIGITGTCPGGGTLSVDQCINATPCNFSQYRNITTGLCTTEICNAPETTNNFGVCSIKECLTSEILNPTNGQCQIPPVCGITERYDPSTNTCILKTLQCPKNSHASTANDRCLPDPPLNCPLGQHDVGTWECVADDAKGCSPGQQVGYINNVLQCINKPNLDTKQKAAADAAKAASDAAAAAKVASDALANNPSDTALQTSSKIASSTATSLQSTSEELNQDSQNSFLKNLSDNIEKQNGGNANQFTKNTDGIFNLAIVNDAELIAKNDFDTQFQIVKTQISSLFTFSNSGSGSLPSFDYGTFYGVQVACDLNRFTTQFSYVALTIMFLAAYISVRIFLD